MEISVKNSQKVYPATASATSFKGRAKSQKPDSVSLSSEAQIKSAQAKLEKVASDYLDKNLQLGKPLIVTAERDFIPFANILQKAAYQKGSGLVSVKIVEPNIEKLKAKYGGTDFEAPTKSADKLRSLGAVEVNVNEISPYATLSKAEKAGIIGTIRPAYSPALEKALKINPKDIIDTDLNLQPGQPLSIRAEREHEKNVERIVEYALKKSPRPVSVTYTNNTSDINFYTYAPDKAFEVAAENTKNVYEEIIGKEVARLIFDGEDATALDAVPSDRISAYNKFAAEAKKPYATKIYETQWCVYYAPTTLSAKDAYPEGKTPMGSLELAAKDVKKLTRVGEHKEHFEKLQAVAAKVNALDIDQVHLYSLDPKTGEKDGKTDLYVGMNPKARFAAASELSKNGVLYYPNIPSEEVFSSPDNTRTNGVVSATKPLVLNGKVVEGIRFEFKDGKVQSVHADTNEELLKNHIADNENADRLGEIALVAGSPIYDTGRLFYNTLLDENATCHLAIGSSFDECIDGMSEITDDDEKDKYRAANNFNYSTAHNDFMVGGKDVVVEAICRDGSKVTLIKDNKYQI
jgi:aminopeptidase